MAQEVLVYNNDVVNDLSITPKIITTLAEIVIRDYHRDYGFSDKVSALDIDSMETNLSGDNDKTMDAAIGIADYNNNRVFSPRILIVEFRMKYSRQGQNSKTSDMKAKDNHTRDLLAGHIIDKHSYFIFDKDVAPCKKNAIGRESQVDSTLKNWRILSPEEFNNHFFFVEDLPYVPTSPIENIRKECCDFVKKANYEKAINLISFWLNKIQSYYNIHNIEECKALVFVIEELLQNVSNYTSDLCENDILELMIAQEDLERFKKLLA